MKIYAWIQACDMGLWSVVFFAFLFLFLFLRNASKLLWYIYWIALLYFYNTPHFNCILSFLWFITTYILHSQLSSSTIYLNLSWHPMGSGFIFLGSGFFPFLFFLTSSNFYLPNLQSTLILWLMYFAFFS
jgi:hypothetical protein